MSKADILAELPKLGLEDRREIFERIGELEERELLNGGKPTAEETALLDRELAEYRQNPEAGSTWNEVEARLRTPSRLLVGASSSGQTQRRIFGRRGRGMNLNAPAWAMNC